MQPLAQMAPFFDHRVLYTHGSKICTHEGLFHAGPHGEGYDQELVRVTHVVEGGDEQLFATLARG